MTRPDFGAGAGALLACALAPAGMDVFHATGGLRMDACLSRRLLESAEAHQIRPQLAAQALRDRLPAAGTIAAELGAAAREIHGRGTFMAGELICVLDVLRAAGIQAVPFKGPAFATLLGDGPGAREMLDLDILVRPGDVVDAAKALASLGYSATIPAQAVASPWLTRVTSELELAGKRTPVTLELHWRLAPHWCPSPCAIDDIMANLAERDVLGRRIDWPAAEELLLVHVADGMKSCGNGMRWIADVVRILRHEPGLDWAHVRRTAARNGGLNIVRVALAIADGLAGEAARHCENRDLALMLAPAAQALADEAARNRRLAGAVQSIRRRVLSDVWSTGAVAHFTWALRLADEPARIAGEIAGYLGRPTVVDLAAMPEEGESDLALRLRALRRRLAGAAT